MPKRRNMFHNKRNHLIFYKSRRNGQITALFLTYLAYMGLHVTRKSFSNIKTNLVYPVCRVDLGHKVFGKNDALCCMGDLVIHGNNNTHGEPKCIELRSAIGLAPIVNTSLNIPPTPVAAP